MKIAGKITVPGVEGTAASPAFAGWSGILATTNKLTDWDYGDGADAGEQKNGKGGYLTVSSSGDTARLTITVVPYDAGGNLATAKSNVKLPPKLAKVTIAGTGIADVDGDWHYARAGGGSIKPDTGGQAMKVTMPLERFEPDGGGAPAYLGDAVAV